MSTGLSRSWDVLEWFIVACLCIVCICLWILVWKVWKSLQKEFSTYDPVVQEPPDGRKDKPIPPSPRERFMTDPIAPKRPDGGEYGWISPFIKEVRKYLNLTAHQNPSEDHTILPMILEKAALGIIEEGKQLGELDEAKKMAKLLMTQRNRGMTDVWKCCAHLYSMENFLHKLLNNSMRGIGDDETEHIWRSKIGTLGPFCFLLWDCPFKNRLTKKIVIYRGAKLETEQIDTYKKMSEHLHEYRSFQAFTSCSRNRNQAERFGNVLFIMEIQRAFTVDMKDFSEFPEEEEELITPGVCFSVQKIGFDKDKNKDLIYLTLTQRFNRKYDSFLHNCCGMIAIFLKIPVKLELSFS